MLRTMLRSKLHRVTVTHTELDYEGSVAIDSRLLEAAEIQDYEQIAIYNIANGERFTSYAVSAQSHSGIVSVMGAAAHKADPGDLLIICTYAQLDAQEMLNFKPRLVYVDAANHLSHTRNSIPTRMAS